MKTIKGIGSEDGKREGGFTSTTNRNSYRVNRNVQMVLTWRRIQTYYNKDISTETIRSTTENDWTVRLTNIPKLIVGHPNTAN